jgi:8-hydroxy-5-deazaflavin:NADPH oxidoreductase
MKIAIVGLGNIGATVARNLSGGGQAVIVADRTPAKAEALAGSLPAGAAAMPVDAAIADADVIILAVYFDAIKELLAVQGHALAGKILVDPSNPIAPDGKGGFKKTIPETQSSGQLIAALLPGGATLVKAFGTLSAESLGEAARRRPEPAVLFYAADNPEAGRTVASLIETSGFAPVSVGGLDQSIRIEVGGDLHEFGKLGQLVTETEAQALVRPGAA